MSQVSGEGSSHCAGVEESTRATDAVLVLFHALTDRERDEVRDRINELKLRELAEGGSPAARSLRSMRRVAEHVGHTPSTAEYRQVSEQLQAAGEGIEPFARVYAHYGSWPRAREALASQRHRR